MRFSISYAISIGLSAILLMGCQQRINVPPNANVRSAGRDDVIVQGHLSAVTHHANEELITMDFSKDASPPKGALYHDFLVITHEKAESQQDGDSEHVQDYETTIDVIPTRLIDSIKFFEKGRRITL